MCIHRIRLCRDMIFQEFPLNTYHFLRKINNLMSWHKFENLIDDKTLFLTFRTEIKGGGGIARINGVLKYLSIHFCSGAFQIFCCIDGLGVFNETEEIRELKKISKFQKRIGQLLVAIGLWRMASVLLLGHKEINILKNKLAGKNLFVFEHLDTTVAYILKKKCIINGYGMDIHGYPKAEFAKNNKFLQRFFVSLHDGLILKQADFICMPSKTLAEMYVSDYPELENSRLTLLPYLIQNTENQKKIIATEDDDYEAYIEVLNFAKEREIIMFIGAFKTNSGIDFAVQSLVDNYNELPANIGVVLIGSGAKVNYVRNLLMQSKLNFLHYKNVSYGNLLIFQNEAACLICPDEHNIFSNSILHLKLLDSLISGREVVASQSPAMIDFGVHEFVHTFVPGDSSSFFKAINKALDSSEKKGGIIAKNFVEKNLTYKNYNIEEVKS
jgi:hypothetical protein